MTDPVVLDKKVRTVLGTQAEGDSLCEEFIAAALARFFPREPAVSEVQESLERLRKRGQAQRTWVSEQARDEWLLTQRGRNLEGLS